MLGYISPATISYLHIYRRNFWSNHFLKSFLAFTLIIFDFTACICVTKGICKFFQSGLISSMRFEEKLDHTNLNPKIIYLHIMGFIGNDWKHIPRNETSQKSVFKTFYYNKQGIREIKHFQSKNFPIRKSTSPFSLITQNTLNPLSLFYDQTLWKDTIISALMIFRENLNWLVYKVFWWLHSFQLVKNSSIFSSL